MARNTDFRTLVARADPDWHQNNENPIEYEFTSPSPPGRSGGLKKPELQENGMRVFRGYYKTRGPYAP